MLRATIRRLVPAAILEPEPVGTPAALDRDRRRGEILIAVALFAFVSNTLFFFVCLIIDPAGLWPLMMSLAVFSALFLTTPLVIPYGAVPAGIYLWAVVGVADVTYVLLAGSGIASHYFLLAGPPIIVMVCGPRRSVLAGCLVAIYAALFLLCAFLLPERTDLVSLPDEFAAASLAFCVVMSVLINLLSALYGFGRAETAEDALDAEHALSERLLNQLVPASVAARLKARPGAVIADTLPEVTVLFADIVGFTPRAARLPAAEVVGMLERIFQAFDGLCERHGVEKIKTIGDAYMAVSGAPTPAPGQAWRLAEMALDMQAECMALSAGSGEEVRLRIGLHSGAAIGGVIGARKPFYDVWGDTVNTAARMESQGEAGRIQVTAEARTAIGPGYRFEEAGTRDIKGKGPMAVFFLVDRSGPGDRVEHAATADA